MIDIGKEKMLTLGEAARMLPGRPSIASLWRWRIKGIRGRRLESVQIGGRTFTSAEALQRFARQDGEPVAKPQTSRQRGKAIDAAERELAKEGI